MKTIFCCLSVPWRGLRPWHAPFVPNSAKWFKIPPSAFTAELSEKRLKSIWFFFFKSYLAAVAVATLPIRKDTVTPKSRLDWITFCNNPSSSKWNTQTHTHTQAVVAIKFGIEFCNCWATCFVSMLLTVCAWLSTHRQWHNNIHFFIITYCCTEKLVAFFSLSLIKKENENERERESGL